MEVLVEEDEVGARFGRRGPALAEGLPLLAHPGEDGEVAGHATTGRPVERVELEGEAHLVEPLDRVQVGQDGTEPTLGVTLDEPLGMQPGERLADRGAGHLETGGEAFLAEPGPERELAPQQERLQRRMGEVPAGPGTRLDAELYTRRST